MRSGQSLMRCSSQMPMILEGAIAMLACARIGAIHSVVFGGFAPKGELARNADFEGLGVSAC